MVVRRFSAPIGPVYYVILKSLSGQIFNTATGSAEDPNVANWADYAIAATDESTSQWHVWTIPASPGLGGGDWIPEVRMRLGGSYAPSDTVVDDDFPLWWDGTTIMRNGELTSVGLNAVQAGLASAASLATAISGIDSILTDTGELQTDWTDGGRLDLLLDGVKGKTDNLPAAPASEGNVSAVGAAVTAVGSDVDALATDLDALSEDIDMHAATVTDLIKSDRVIDTTTDPWQEVWLVQYTGGLGGSGSGDNELLRRNLYAIDGSPMTSLVFIGAAVSQLPGD
ncbi:MAG: hypothetical protein AB7E98_11970 [Pirellulales bacterium]